MSTTTKTFLIKYNNHQVVSEMEVSAESDESLGGLEAEVCRCDVKRAAVLKLLAGVVHVDALQRLNEWL